MNAEQNTSLGPGDEYVLINEMLAYRTLRHWTKPAEPSAMENRLEHLGSRKQPFATHLTGSDRPGAAMNFLASRKLRLRHTAVPGRAEIGIKET